MDSLRVVSAVPEMQSLDWLHSARPAGQKIRTKGAS
jgi:hypothetical protein